MDIPNDEIMRQMSKLALEKAMLTISNLARQHAAISKGIDGEAALLAFADAMLSTNKKVFPVGESQ